MNEACAAGTGSFLEEQAEKLGISIKGEFARDCACLEEPFRLGERCTVFMERDVTGQIAQGCRSRGPCRRTRLLGRPQLPQPCRSRTQDRRRHLLSGGTAYNDAVAAAFSQILDKRSSFLRTTVSSVLSAWHSWRRIAWPAATSPANSAATTQAVNFTTREFVCQACSNFCDIKEFKIEGHKTYWGDKCSDKFRKRARADRKPVIDDLVNIATSYSNRF